MSKKIELPAGTIVAERYEIVALLGHGGVGYVYEAKDLKDNTTIAIKILVPQHARNMAVVARLKQEVELSRVISGENNIKVYEFGSDAAQRYVYMTMELIRGENLAQKIEKAKALPHAERAPLFDLKTINFFLSEIAKGIANAHAHGVIHRDIKPSNIIVSEDGSRVVITDLGISRSISTSLKLTVTNEILGTASYMSPQQIRADKELDHRTDIYSFGVLAYELVSGVRPLDGESEWFTRSNHSKLERPYLGDVANSPAYLNQLARRCFQYDPAARPATMNDVIALLSANVPSRSGRQDFGACVARLKVALQDTFASQSFVTVCSIMLLCTLVLAVGCVTFYSFLTAFDFTNPF